MISRGRLATITRSTSMDDQKSEERRRAEFEAEVERLRGHASTSVNRCDVAKLIAVSDARVIEALDERLRRGDRPRGVHCLAPGRVLFAFDCPPGTICLVSRSFLVTVDIAARRVTEITDPYDPTDDGEASRAPATLPGRTAPAALRPLGGSGRAAFAAESISLFTAGAAREIGGNATTKAGTLKAAELSVRLRGDGFHEVRAMTGTSDQRSASITIPSAGTYEVAITVRSDDETAWEGTIALGDTKKTSGPRTVLGGGDLWFEDLTAS
jgi:hypothetical protein